MKPDQLNVPKDKFKKEFGVSWDAVLQNGLAFNAMDACAHLGLDVPQLTAVWEPCKKVKFGGGFYCGRVEAPGKPVVYVFNGFFMSMRAKFVDPAASIHYFLAEFDPAKLSWADFRGAVLGPTDPKQAPADSLRGIILSRWSELGLPGEPNVSDNGVHASASPFEGLAERLNWLQRTVDADPFGQALLAAGVPEETIKAWTIDPQVSLFACYSSNFCLLTNRLNNLGKRCEYI